MNEVVPTNGAGAIMEQVMIKGDLSRLSPEERSRYYTEVCRSIGLNPLTRPMEYITLNGKLTLYARRDAADQLRKINGISVEIVNRTVQDGLLFVHVRAKDRSGRTDEDLGVVNIAGLKGEAAANAVLKGITKAKRRVTLSIAGLGFLDETEIEDIPTNQRSAPKDVTPRNGNGHRAPAKPAAVEPPMHPETGEFSPHAITVPQTADGQSPDWMAWGAKMAAAFKASKSREELVEWQSENVPALNNCKADAPKIHARLLTLLEERAKEMGEPVEVLAGEPDPGILGAG